MSGGGEVPEGWVEVRLSDAVRLQNGPFGSLLHKSDYVVGGMPLINPANIVAGRLVPDAKISVAPDTVKRLASYVMMPGDVVVGRRGEMGRAALVTAEQDSWFCGTGCAFLRMSPAVHGPFLAHWFGSPEVRQRLENDAVGATMSNLSTRILSDLPLNLPPVAEQKRIVEKVEGLLAEVNGAREHLARVPVILKRLRQAVLAAACSGRLTEGWREGQVDLVPPAVGAASQTPTKRQGRLWGGGDVPDLTDDERESIPSCWTWMKVAELGESIEETVQIGPMSMKSSSFTASGVPVLNVGCVQPGYVDTSKCDFLPERVAATFERYRVQPKDVLFTRSGTVGRCAVAGAEHAGAVITFHLLRVRPDQSRCLSSYLWAAFQGAPSIRRQTGEGQIGSTRAGFNTRLLQSLDVPVPPVLEQAEIMRRVEALFAIAGAIENRVKLAAVAAERLPQAVLSKAFRGDLAPTEAELARAAGRSYETAEEMLARLKRSNGSQPEPSAKKRRGREGPGKVAEV